MQEVFNKVAGGAFEITQPDFVVLCCGADGLARDPLGGWALTPAALAAAARAAKAWGAPLLVLGGGGYNCANAARAWAAVTAAVAGLDLPSDVPLHEFSNLYGPSYTMQGDEDITRPDENDPQAVARVCDEVLERLRAAVQGGSSRQQQGRAAGREPAAAAETSGEVSEEASEESGASEERCSGGEGESSGEERGRVAKRPRAEATGEAAAAPAAPGAAVAEAGLSPCGDPEAPAALRPIFTSLHAAAAAAAAPDAAEATPHAACRSCPDAADVEADNGAACCPHALSPDSERLSSEQEGGQGSPETTDSPASCGSGGSGSSGAASGSSDSLLCPVGADGAAIDEAWWRELKSGLVLIVGCAPIAPPSCQLGPTAV